MTAEVETLEGLEIREEVELCNLGIIDKTTLTGGKRNNCATAFREGGSNNSVLLSGDKFSFIVRRQIQYFCLDTNSVSLSGDKFS